MSKKQKLLEKILNSQKNIRFDELVLLAQYFGFETDRINGSHHQMRHRTLAIKLNIQPNQEKAKAYQVRQLIEYIETLGLGLEDE
jgi:predicted RNA binding protein YcfA (HicA-like mRNA interferase family)